MGLGAVQLTNPPPNDNFSNATVIHGFPLTVTGSNVGATKEPGEPHHADNSGGRSVWWSWMAPISTQVTVTTAGSSFDTLLGVYTGDAVSNLTPVASDNDSGNNASSLVRFAAVAGTMYHLAVDGYGYDPGSGYQVFTGTITLAIANAPTNPPPTVSLTRLPYGQVVVTPTNLTLTAAATPATTNVAIASIQFFHETNLLGTVNTSPYSMVWSNPPPGLYALTAVATDTAGVTNGSLPVLVTITLPPRLDPPSLANTPGLLVRLHGIGPRYTLQRSSNLNDWVAVGTLTNVDPEATFLDPGPTNLPQRFYRAQTPPPYPAPISGWLHTANGLILDGQNHPVLLRGINSSGMEYGTGRPYGPGGGYALPPTNEYATIARWGFNTVRLPIAWANLETNAPHTNTDGSLTRYYNETYLRAVDNIVQQFGQHHIAVIFSMHQWGWSPAYQLPRADGTVIHGYGMPTWLYPNTNLIDATQARIDFFANVDDVQAGYIAAWTNVATRYATNATVVGADMVNEPSTIADYSHSTPPAVIPLDGFYARLGQALLGANPRLLLFFQQGPGTPVNGPPPFRNQVVFSFHEYPRNWPYDGRLWALDYWRRATNWNVPLWLGEFGVVGPATVTAGPAAWPTQTLQMLQWCNARNIGWSQWAYDRAVHSLNGVGGTGPADWDLLRLLQAAF